MNLPRATQQYDPADQDRLRNALELAVTGVERKPNIRLISADRGDTNVTLVAGQDQEVQRFATTLTVNRTVTLSNGFAGAEFRIVRTGLGAFTLNVGGLKTIPSATAAFVDVGHTGTGWILTGYGVL